MCNLFPVPLFFPINFDAIEQSMAHWYTSVAIELIYKKIL